MDASENKFSIGSTRLFGAVLICLLSIARPGIAQPQSGTFLTDIRFSSYAEIGTSSGMPNVLSGMRIPMTSESPEGAAIEFLQEHGGALGLNVNDYQLVESRPSTSGDVHVIFNRSDESRLVIGVNRPPVFLSRERDNTTNSAPSRTPVPGYIVGDVIGTGAETPNWYVYFVTRYDVDVLPERIVSSAPQPAFLGIDREDPTTQRLTNQHDPAPPGPGCPSGDYSGTATAMVYMPNPLHGNLVQVELKNLCKQTPFTLEGRSVSVTPDGLSRSYSSSGNFSAEPSSVMFDEASAYYHVDRFLELMRNTGMDEIIPADYQMDVSVKSKEGYSALAEYEDNTLHFGVIEGPFMTALYESAFIAHEAMHNLMFWHYKRSYIGRESKEHWVMGEAFPDYIGLAYRARLLGHYEPWRNPVIGEYYSLETSENLPRDLTDPRPHLSGFLRTNYVGHGEGTSQNNLYDNSVIYSTALMDYDRSDDNEHSLSFVIKSLNLLENYDAANFSRGREALIQAVNSCAVIGTGGQQTCCESGACAAPVIAAFDGRGIYASDDPRQTNPDYGTQSGIKLVTVNGNYPSPFPNTTTIDFSLSISTPLSITVLDINGRTVRTLRDYAHRAGPHKVDWQPSNESSGMYFIEFRTPSTVMSHPVLYIR